MHEWVKGFSYEYSWSRLQSIFISVSPAVTICKSNVAQVLHGSQFCRRSGYYFLGNLKSLVANKLLNLVATADSDQPQVILGTFASEDDVLLFDNFHSLAVDPMDELLDFSTTFIFSSIYKNI